MRNNALYTNVEHTRFSLTFSGLKRLKQTQSLGDNSHDADSLVFSKYLHDEAEDNYLDISMA
jgi:hypothetical protein